jgi:hypothetical protein
MDAHDFISSEILYDYCLGLLTNEGELKVEAMCHQYPELARELRLLRHALEKYAGSNTIVQREELRKAVWQNEKSCGKKKGIKHRGIIFLLGFCHSSNFCCLVQIPRHDNPSGLNSRS